MSSYPSVLVGASDSSTSMASSVSPSLLAGGPSATSGLMINKGIQHLHITESAESKDLSFLYFLDLISVF